MDRQILSGGPGRLALGAEGENASLSITDGITVQFGLEVAVLKSVLEDDVLVQVSQEGSYCRIERVDSRVRFDFVLAGSGRGVCALDASEFVEALAGIDAQVSA